MAQLVEGYISDAVYLTVSIPCLGIGGMTADSLLLPQIIIFIEIFVWLYNKYYQINKNKCKVDIYFWLKPYDNIKEKSNLFCQGKPDWYK